MDLFFDEPAELEDKLNRRAVVKTRILAAIVFFSLVWVDVVSAQTLSPSALLRTYAIEVSGDDEKAERRASAQYEREYIRFDEWGGIQGSGNAVRRTGSVAYLGKYRIRLKGGDFYDAMDRPDLAARYRR